MVSWRFEEALNWQSARLNCMDTIEVLSQP
jgi:hypothetical protein